MSAKHTVNRSIYNINDKLNYTHIEKKLIRKHTVCYLISAWRDMLSCNKKVFSIKFTRGRKYISINWSLFQIRETDREWKQSRNQVQYYLHNLHTKFQDNFWSSFYLAIFMHSCLYKKALFGLHQTYKQGKKPTRQKEMPMSNSSSWEPYSCRPSNLHNAFWLISPIS